MSQQQHTTTELPMQPYYLPDELSTSPRKHLSKSGKQNKPHKKHRTRDGQNQDDQGGQTKPKNKGVVEKFASSVKLAYKDRKNDAGQRATSRSEAPFNAPETHRNLEPGDTSPSRRSKRQTMVTSPYAPQLALDFPSATPWGYTPDTRTPATHLRRFDKAATSHTLRDEMTNNFENIRSPHHDIDRPRLVEMKSSDSLHRSKDKSWVVLEPVKAQIKSPPVEESGVHLTEQMLLTRAGFDFPELRGPENETSIDAVRRFIEQYRVLNAELSTAVQSYNNANVLAAEKHNLQGIVERLETDLHTTRAFLQSRSTELANLEAELIRQKTESFNTHERASANYARHEYYANGLKSNILKLEREIENQKSAGRHHMESCTADRLAKQEEIKRQERLVADMTKQRDDVNLNWQSHLKKINIDHEERMEKSKIVFDRLEADLRGHHNNEMDDEKERHRKAIKRLQEEMSQMEIAGMAEKQQLQEQIRLEKERADDIQARRSKELKDQETHIKQKYALEIRRLQSTVEEFKQQSVKRTHFRGLRDRDLTNQFTSIVNQLRDFANLDWDTRMQSDWPYTEHQLLEIHKNNIRKLKKQLLQNSLWVILYEHIFRTPFQVFGAEGSELDSDWVQIHGTNVASLDWPDIPAEVEKKRHQTAQSFLTVIEPSTKASGQNLRLKASYERSITTIVDALLGALGKITTLDQRQSTTLEGLVRLCAKTWLQFGSQPYRLLVAMPMGSGDLLSTPQRHERVLTLVLNPELKRYGNSQGENLKRGEVIPDCQAAVQAYPAR